MRNIEKLTQAEDRGKGFALAEEIDKLSSKDEVKAGDVEALRKAYNALNDKQKKDVYTYNNLLIMEKLIKLQAEVDKIGAGKDKTIVNPLGRPVDKLKEGIKAPATGNATGVANSVDRKSVV